nr:hypothetical protein [Alteripontixanthobacter muriae]
MTIEPVPGSVSLRVTGDVETLLTVPFDDNDRFLLGLSDGTLLLGTYDEDLRCGWKLSRQGAGAVRFIAGSVTINAPVEWAIASIYDPNVVEPQLPRVLPLFPHLDRWVA